MNIELLDTAPDGLTGQRWLFWVTAEHGGLQSCLIIRLDEWEPMDRPTKRHNWRRSGEGYHRRSNDFHHRGYTRPASEVPMPPDVRERLLAEITQRLDVIGAEDPPERRR